MARRSAALVERHEQRDVLFRERWVDGHARPLWVASCRKCLDVLGAYDRVAAVYLHRRHEAWCPGESKIQ